MAEGGHTVSEEMVDDLPFNDSLGSLESIDDHSKQKKDGSSSQSRSRVKVYPEWAKGPYVVFFRQIDRPLNVLHISDILYRTYSSIKEVKKISLKKLRAVFANRADANAVVTNTSLTNLYRVYVPCEHVEISGVVYDALLDPSYVEQHGVGHFKNENVSPVAVLECSRLVTKSLKDDIPQFDASDAIRVTFAGTALPEFLNVHNVLFRVRLYTPKLMHCELCQAFNHTAKFCARKVKCAKCNGNHTTNSCSAVEEKCLKCQDKHDSLKDCPVYQEQRKTNRKKLINRSRLSYAEMLKAATPVIDTANKYDVLNTYSDDLGDQDSEEAHCSYTVPIKRKKPMQQTKSAKHPSESTSSPKSSMSNKPPPPPTDWPALPKSNDIPGFRKVENGTHHTDDLQKTLQQLLKLICNLFSVDAQWVQLMDRLIPLVSPLVKKLCENLPLIGALLNLNG